MSMLFNVLAGQRQLTVAETIRYKSDFAVALHKLTAEATTCLTVRRSSDNAEQDFGFVSSAIGAAVDWAAIGAWVGTGNTGRVSKWWDQSANERHFVQTTAAYQPTCWWSTNVAPTIFGANVLYGDGRSLNITNIGTMCQGASSTQLTCVVTDRGINQSATVMPVYFYRLSTAATQRMNLRKGNGTSVQLRRTSLFGRTVYDTVSGTNSLTTGEIENCLAQITQDVRWYQGAVYLRADKHNAGPASNSATIGTGGETFGSSPVTDAILGHNSGSSQHDLGEFIQFSSGYRNGIPLWADVVAEQKARYPV